MSAVLKGHHYNRVYRETRCNNVLSLFCIKEKEGNISVYLFGKEVRNDRGLLIQNGRF